MDFNNRKMKNHPLNPKRTLKINKFVDKLKYPQENVISDSVINNIHYSIMDSLVEFVKQRSVSNYSLLLQSEKIRQHSVWVKEIGNTCKSVLINTLALEQQERNKIKKQTKTVGKQDKLNCNKFPESLGLFATPVKSCIKDTSHIYLYIFTDVRLNYSTLWPAQQRNRDSHETRYKTENMRKSKIEFIRKFENRSIKIIRLNQFISKSIDFRLNTSILYGVGGPL